MSVIVEAIYENGVLRPREPLPLREHETVRVTVEPTANGRESPTDSDQPTGVNEGSVVAAAAERAPAKSRRMTEVEQRMMDDLDWASEAPEVQQNPDYHGKFVVVQDRQILGFGRDRMALAKEIEEKAGIPALQQVVVIVHRPGSFLQEIPH